MKRHIVHNSDGDIVAILSGMSAAQAALNTPDGHTLLEIGDDVEVESGLSHVRNGKVSKRPIDPQVTRANDERELRQKRNSMLAASDWTQLVDAQVDKNAWAVYRQRLRDLPATASDAANPNWPDVPANAQRRFET